MSLDSCFSFTQLESICWFAAHLSLHFKCALQGWKFYWPSIRQQAAEVGRRQFRNKEVGGNVDNTLKLQTAEQKMGELTSAMAVLGKEAAAAMTAVEAQQQRLTLQRLIAMVSLVDNRNSKFHLYICLPNRYKWKCVKVVALYNDVHVKCWRALCFDAAQVEAERSYHQRVAEILDQLQAQVFAVLYLHSRRGGLLMLAFLSSLEKAIYADK